MNKSTRQKITNSIIIGTIAGVIGLGIYKTNENKGISIQTVNYEQNDSVYAIKSENAKNGKRKVSIDIEPQYIADTMNFQTYIASNGVVSEVHEEKLIRHHRQATVRGAPSFSYQEYDEKIYFLKKDSARFRVNKYQEQFEYYKHKLDSLESTLK